MTTAAAGSRDAVAWPRIVRRALAATSLLLANLTRLRIPVKVNLCVTYWCQYRCKTCNIWRRKPTGELSTDELLQFVRQNPQIAWLDVTGGEIFLRKDIGDFFGAVATTWKKLALVHFATNGFLTDRIVATARRIAAATPAELIVTVSLDGEEELNDEIRGIAGGFQRQVETFNALRRIPGIRTVFGMTISRHNAGHFESTFQACRRACPGLAIEDFHLNVAQRSMHYYGNAEMDDLRAPHEATVAELRRHQQMRGVPLSPSAWVESRYLHHLQGFLSTGVTPMRCHALRSSCFIDPQGTVFPCITYTRPIGNLRDTGMSLDPIWGSRVVSDVQGEIWAGRCPQCWTSCEAYQSILGNLVRIGRSPRLAMAEAAR